MARALPRGIYGITSGEFGMGHVEAAGILLEAGVRIVQYREKSRPARAMVEEARAIRELCSSYGAIFIVDDRADVAYASDADGVHLGQEDLPVEQARRMLGGAIIGASASTPAEASRAELEGADYIGAGSVFPSPTKGGARVIGPEGLASIVRSVRVPVYAIGGIRLEHLRELRSLGVHGVAVISAILGSPDTRAAARAFVEEWSRADRRCTGPLGSRAPPSSRRGASPPRAGAGEEPREGPRPAGGLPRQFAGGQDRGDLAGREQRGGAPDGGRDPRELPQEAYRAEELHVDERAGRGIRRWIRADPGRRGDPEPAPLEQRGERAQGLEGAIGGGGGGI
ncbi:MAG: thiamine phosphate synthase [Nitrososphaeria archaeon]